MPTPSLRTLSLAGTLACASACFADKGLIDEPTSSTTAQTGATTGLSASATGMDPTMVDPTTTSSPESSTTTSTGDPSEDPTAGAPDQFCQEACQADADCMIMQTDEGFTCQANRCVSASNKCDSDEACRAVFSGWVTACTEQAGCPGQVCVDIGAGVGRCATPPSDFVTCETLMQSDVMVPPIEGGMTVVVCANIDYVCKDSTCQNPCEDNAACADVPGHPACDVDTGTCMCTADVDCTGTPIAGYAACNAGTCGCAVDSDCKDVPNADRCTMGGSCGCSADEACTDKVFDGTVAVCEGLPDNSPLAAMRPPR